MNFNINRVQQNFENSLGEKVVYTINEDDVIEYLNIAGTEIISSVPEFQEQGFMISIKLFEGNASIGVYDVNDDKDALASDFVPLEELTTQKFAELIGHAKIEQENKHQEEKNFQMAEDANKEDFLLQDSQPLIEQETFKVRGDGRCFIASALYQYYKNAGLDDEDLTNMGFYSEYNPQSRAVQEIEGYYKKFFKQNPASVNNHDVAPDVDLMKDFLEKELCIGIKVEYYGNKSNGTIIRNSGQDKQPVNQNGIITVALLSHDRHVVLPETINKMKERGIKIEEVQNQEDIDFLKAIQLSLNQAQDLNNQSQFGSQQQLNGYEEENFFDRFARENENNLNNEDGIRPEDVRIAINEERGDVGGAYANNGIQIEEGQSSSSGDVGGSANPNPNPNNSNILAEIPQLLRVSAGEQQSGAGRQMQQSVINIPQNRANRSFLAKLCSCIPTGRLAVRQ